MAQRFKRLPAMRETWVRSLGHEDPLEQEMATHFSILARIIPWTEDLVCYSSWDLKELDTTEREGTHDWPLLTRYQQQMPRLPVVTI